MILIPNSTDTKFYFRQAIILFTCGLFLTYIYPYLKIDETLINWFYDSDKHQFPLKHNWFLETFMHKGLKYLMITIALLTCCLWSISLRNPQFAHFRDTFFKTFLGMVVATVSVSFVKQFSIHACPWDLSLYGGNQPLLVLFESLPRKVSLGKCFPGGHASGGFSLWAFYFFFRDCSPSIALWGLYAGVFFGFVMGWSQMMRGAHFMSHNLWSAWLVWFVLLILHYILNINIFKSQ